MDLSLDLNSTCNSRSQLILTPKYLSKLKSCKRILTPVLTKHRSIVTLNEDCNWRNVVCNLEDSIAMESNLSLDLNSTYNSRSKLILNPRYLPKMKTCKRILKPLLTKQRSNVTLNKDCNSAEIVVKCTEKHNIKSQTISKNIKETLQKSFKKVCKEAEYMTNTVKSHVGFIETESDENNNNKSQTKSKRTQVTLSESPLQVTKPLRDLPPSVVFVCALNI